MRESVELSGSATARLVIATVAVCIFTMGSPCSVSAQTGTNLPVFAIRIYGATGAVAIAQSIGSVLTNREDWCAVDPVDVVRVHRREGVKGAIMDSDESVRIGAWLKSALVVDVAGSKESSNVQVVAYDSLTGARLCDVPLHGTNSTVTARAAVAVLGAMGKCRDMGSPTQTVRAVSVARITRANATAANAKADAVAVFHAALERALLGSRRVVVADRALVARLENESHPKGSRLDLLKSTAVRVEVDLTLTGEDAVERAVASMAGQAGDTSRVEIAPPGGLATDAAAQALAGRILMALDLPESPLDPAELGVEAKRSRELWKLLKKRSYMSDVSTVVEVGFMLSELALRETPDDEKIQKTFSFFLRQHAESVSDPRELLTLCERDLVLAEKWAPRMSGPTDDFDMRTCVGGFVQMLRKALEAADGFTWGKNGRDPRIVALRERCGEWIVRMRQHDWRYMCYLYNVDIYARDVDHLLEELDKWMTFLPGGLLSDDRIAPASIPGLALNHTMGSFTPAQRRRLFSLYQKWGTMGDLGSRAGSLISGARLVMAYPQDFDAPNELVKEQFMRMAEQIAADPIHEVTFRAYMFRGGWGGDQRLVDQLRFPREAVIPAVKRLIELIEAKGVCVPYLYDVLDNFAPDTADRPGAYMERAWEQLHRQGCRLPSGKGRTVTPIELVRETMNKRYRQRYGRDLPEFKTVEPALVEYKAGPPFATVGRGEKFIDSERLGDAVYVLALMYGGTDYGVYRIDTGTALSNGAARLIGTHGAIRTLGYGESPSLSVSTNMACVAVPAGVLLFPLDGSAPRAILADGSMPLPKVDSCCEAEGWIYAGCSSDREGMLVKCRPDGSGMTILTHSNRREGRTELDRSAYYHVESILHDAVRKRLFLTVLLEGAWTGWSYVVDLPDDKVFRVFKKHNFIKQPFLLPDGRYLVRVHSNSSNFNNYPGYWGYGIWDPADFSGNPLDNFEKRVVPLVGSVHRDSWNWTGGKPHFSGFTNVVPGSSEAMFLLDEKTMLATDGKRWQALSRSDSGGYKQNLPMIGGAAPFAMYHATNGVMLAVASNAVWDFGVRQLSYTVPLATAETHVVVNTNLVATTELVVRTPAGARVSVDGGEPYRSPGGTLRWAGLPEGVHRLGFAWYSNAVQREVVLASHSTTNVVEMFGEDKVERLVLRLNGVPPVRFVRIEPGFDKFGPDNVAKVEKGFWMSECEITRAQYAAVIPCPEGFDGDMNRPVETNEGETAAFCAELQVHVWKDELGGRKVRVPTSDEWAHAASSGTGMRYYCGGTAEDIERDGWFPASGRGITDPVGTRPPSPWWIYDLLGNAGEWVMAREVQWSAGLVPRVYGQLCYPDNHQHYGSPPAGIRLVIADPE